VRVPPLVLFFFQQLRAAADAAVLRQGRSAGVPAPAAPVIG
jgi:hypothetical protein